MLAKPTAEVTEDIAQKIEAIQDATDKAVQAPTESSEVITQISNLYTAIAAALEKQTANSDNSKEIGPNASEAASGGKELAQNISSGARNRLGRPRQPACWRRVHRDSWMTTALQDLVNRFKISLPAAFYAPESRGLYR
ncbi:MAG: hypothetical protein JHC85_12550 [Chthoniobacterales bacterium]|nr:hypothetical protein [Chthoniobacterales bacterium]